jgi:hypothetical protein
MNRSQPQALPTSSTWLDHNNDSDYDNDAGVKVMVLMVVRPGDGYDGGRVEDDGGKGDGYDDGGGGEVESAMKMVKVMMVWMIEVMGTWWCW